MSPVVTRATGAERIYDGYPDVALEVTDHRTFDRSIQLVEYPARVLVEPRAPFARMRPLPVGRPAGRVVTSSHPPAESVQRTQ